MTRTSTLILLLLLSIRAHSQDAQDVHNCNFTALVWDEDTKGTNIRNGPKGTIIDKIYPDTAETGYTVKVIGSSSRWIQCKYTSINGKEITGWIFGDMIRLGTRNYGDNQYFNLYSSHSKTSKITTKVLGEKDVQVLGCHEEWAYVKVKSDGRVYFGWLEPDMQCASAVTNCC